MNQIYLEKFQVKNFKNLEQKILEFSPQINCIFGGNGNGKTNLLEAIYFLINRKSFKKKVSFPQIINVECEKPEILFMSSIFANEKRNSLSGTFKHDNTEWFYNNTISKKNHFKTVLISPFDSNLFHTDNQFRRHWVDHHFSLLSEDYKKDLLQFKKALKFRNALLQKKPYRFEEQIKAGDENFAEYNYKCLKHRLRIIEELQSYCSNIFNQIFHENHELKLEIESEFKNYSVNEIKQILAKNMAEDINSGRTKSGIHRDNIHFNFDGYNSFEYCSLGQQKMSFLSLVFAYIELFRYKCTTYPIVLMDDVSGELDKQRWLNLIVFLKSKNFQVFITTANENFKFELEKLENAKKFNLENGNLKEY